MAGSITANQHINNSCCCCFCFQFFSSYAVVHDQLPEYIEFVWIHEQTRVRYSERLFEKGRCVWITDDVWILSSSRYFLSASLIVTPLKPLKYYKEKKNYQFWRKQLPARKAANISDIYRPFVRRLSRIDWINVNKTISSDRTAILFLIN